MQFLKFRNAVVQEVFKHSKAVKFLRKKNESLIRRRFASFAKRKPAIDRRPVRKDVILSLTSWSQRLDILPLALMTLVEQSVRPARIEVWLTQPDLDAFDPTLAKLFTDHGVQFRPSQDFGPHKKWLNSILEGEDKLLVTADDDLLYSRWWLECLLMNHSDDDRCTVAHRCHRIRLGIDGEIAPYNQWEMDVKPFGEISSSLFATGGAGQLLRKSWFNPKFLDSETILKLAPKADDVWINCALRACGIPVKRSDSYFPLFEVKSSKKTSLYRTNLHGGMNDVQLKAVMDYYRLDRSLFF